MVMGTTTFGFLPFFVFEGFFLTRGCESFRRTTKDFLWWRRRFDPRISAESSFRRFFFFCGGEGLQIIDVLSPQGVRNEQRVEIIRKINQ